MEQPNPDTSTNTATAFANVQQAFVDVHKVNKLPGFTYDQVKSVRSMKYGPGEVSRLQTILSKIPSSIPEKTRLELFTELAEAAPAVVDEVFCKLGPHTEDAGVGECLVFAPNIHSCINCEKNLEVHNKNIDVRYFGIDGKEIRKKVTLRCNNKRCRTTYHLTTYGKQNDFYLYDIPVDVVETTD